MAPVKFLLACLLLSTWVPPSEGLEFIQQLINFFKEIYLTGDNSGHAPVTEDVKSFVDAHKAALEEEKAAEEEIPVSIPTKKPSDQKKKVLVLTASPEERAARLNRRLRRDAPATVVEKRVDDDEQEEVIIANDKRKPITKEEIKSIFAKIRSEFRNRRIESRTIFDTLEDMLPEGFFGRFGSSALSGFRQFIRQIIISMI